MPPDSNTARVAPIADVPVDIWAAPSWTYTGTPSNPHKTKNQECRDFDGEAAGHSAAEASKGGCSIDTGITHRESYISISTGTGPKIVNSGSLKRHINASEDHQ